MVRYVFDSNIFMDLQRRQPLDLYPSVWEKVGALMKDGTIISSHEVFEEILAGSDELVLWAKQREDYFLPSTETVQRIVREILKEHRGLVEGGKKKNNADPFVIAIAKEYNCIVVTSETPNGSREAPKIPDVCNALSIGYLDFVGFQRAMKLTF